jgi:hypothetical protein
MTYDQLQAMPYTELHSLHQRVCDVLKTKRELKAKETQRNVNVGMTVTFTGRKGEGNYIVQRVNRTTISAKHSETGQSWKLPLSGVQIVS